MLTKTEALNSQEFHLDACKRIRGPRQGITERITRYRRNGRTQTWVTRPDDFRIPVVHALKGYGAITQNNARDFHTTANCPIIDLCCSCETFGVNYRDFGCFCHCHNV